MKPTKRTCAAMAALVVLSFTSGWASAGGTYYRWTDENGTPVNSDRPPPTGIEYEMVSTGTNNMVTGGMQEDEGLAPAKPGSGRSPTQEAVTEQRIVVAKNPEACEAARKNLDALNTHARIRIPDGQGSFRYLNEEEKAAQRVEAEASISANCE